MIQSCPSSPAAIQVLCVDDNELVVEAIGIKLRLAGGFKWLGQLTHAGRLVAEVERLHPDVVLLDIDMPGRDPFDALEEVTHRFPEVRVLMFSGHIRSELVDRAIEAGAWGYLSKHDSAESVVSAIRRVAAGEFVMGREAGAHIDG